MTQRYQCKGCDEVDSIVEISLVPRVVGFHLDEDGRRDYDNKGWDRECFWEAETILGYGCMNDQCEHWQGHWGSARDQEPGEQVVRGTFLFGGAPNLDDIAEIAKEEA